jgi:hypothetical protein
MIFPIDKLIPFVIICAGDENKTFDGQCEPNIRRLVVRIITSDRNKKNKKQMIMLMRSYKNEQYIRRARKHNPK